MTTLSTEFLSFIVIALSNTVTTKVTRFCSEPDHCYILATDNYKTWSDAQETCRNLNSTLPIVDKPNNRKGFADALKNLTQLQNNFWIGAKASHDNGTNWRWLDGSQYYGTVSGGNPWSYERSYAYMSVNKTTSSGTWILTAQIVASRPIEICQYICQFPSSEFNGCVNKAGQMLPNLTGNVCYVAYNQTVDWFNARNNCLTQGGDLASFRNDLFQYGGNQSASIVALLLSSLGAAPDRQRFWMGLRSSWWNWSGTLTGVSKDVTFSYWNNGQPNGNFTQCISTEVFNVTEIEPAWRDWDCTDKLPFICQEPESHSTKVSAQTTGNPKGVNESSARESSTPSVIPLAVGIGVGVGVPLLIVVIVVIVVLSIRRKRKTENTNMSRSPESIVRDSEDSYSKSANQRPAEGNYGIVEPHRNAAGLQPAPTKPSGAVYAGLSFNEECV